MEQFIIPSCHDQAHLQLIHLQERISSGSTPLAKFKIKRSGSLSSATNKPENFQNLSSEQFPDISKLMMSEPLDKPGTLISNLTYYYMEIGLKSSSHNSVYLNHISHI